MIGSEVDGRVAASLEAIALLLAERFKAGGLLREREFEHVFEEVVTSDPAVHVLPSKSPQLVHWRKPFAIDTTAVLPGEETLAAELKWGGGTLYNCAWDLAKLGVVVAEGRADHAYLVAGAPASEWESGLGRDLFDNGNWTPEALRTRFGKHFAFWAKDVPTTGPIDLPSVIQARLVSVVAVPGWEGDWTLRAARVGVADPKWVPWQTAAA